MYRLMISFDTGFNYDETEISKGIFQSELPLKAEVEKLTRKWGIPEVDNEYVKSWVVPGCEIVLWIEQIE